jgi:hypothetical protein
MKQAGKPGGVNSVVTLLNYRASLAMTVFP